MIANHTTADYIGWLQAWVDGYSIKEIAEMNDITVPMLYNGFRNMRRKYRANDSVQLVGILFRKNYLK